MALKCVDEIAKNLLIPINQERSGIGSIEARENTPAIGGFWKGLGLYFQDTIHVRRDEKPNHIPLFFFPFLI